uniref:Uncharacterized protein n=1 Tax=Tanacetum cinerariifolium TaxID=118510 RepID=A0A6L2LQW2_TANCI|nr:hypothetical protein [Tanacetum cinerariifolium]
METIHVKFDKLIAMASECNNSGPDFSSLNFQDSSEDSNAIPSKEDLATPTVVVQKKKRKQVVGEAISLRKSLKVTIKQKKPSTTPIPPLNDDRERDDIAEATQLRGIEKIVEGEDEESYASKFVDLVFFIEEEDFGTRLELGGHKENPKIKDHDDEERKKDDEKDGDNDDDDNDDHTHHTLIKTQVTGSLASRNE